MEEGQAKFSILQTFRTHSHDIVDKYQRTLHKEKDFLKERGLSPKHRHSSQVQYQQLMSVKNKPTTASNKKRRPSQMNNFLGLQGIGNKRDRRVSRLSGHDSASSNQV